MLHLLLKKKKKANSSLGGEFKLNCALLQWRLSFGILPEEGEIFYITIMLFTTVRISYVKTGKADEKLWRVLTSEGSEIKKENPDSHKMK